MLKNKGLIAIAEILLCAFPLISHASSPATIPPTMFAIPENERMQVVVKIADNGDYLLRPMGSSGPGKWYSKENVAMTDRTLCRESGKCINNIIVDATGASLTIGGFFSNGDYAVSSLGSGIYSRHSGKNVASTTTGLPTKGNFVVGDFVRNSRGQHFRISGVYSNGDMALREMLPEVSRSTPTSETDFAFADCGIPIGPSLRTCRPFVSLTGIGTGAGTGTGDSWIIEGVYANGDLLIKALYSIDCARRMSRSEFQAKFEGIALD